MDLIGCLWDANQLDGHSAQKKSDHDGNCSTSPAGMLQNSAAKQGLDVQGNSSQGGSAVSSPQRQDALQLRQLPARHVATEPSDPTLPAGPLVSTVASFKKRGRDQKDGFVRIACEEVST
ncbi:hypothetical protein K0M31_003018 [Melipona bicolor]|uniref:Uncharacterized protein n=1 Tax=Melipona bicolor TaxID=60889 RepID=A0AA40G0B4_9HYME|nr:hypothetical protein K0M31_003018 [Melipona bicolor]